MIESVGGVSDGGSAMPAAASPAARRAGRLLDRLGDVVRPASQEDEHVPVLPVPAALRGLFPTGGLTSGSVTSVRDGGVDHVGYLPLALLAGGDAETDDPQGVTRQRLWCAVVGVPELGVAAAASLGVGLERLLLVQQPGPRWPEVVTALLGGVDVVLLRPPWGDGTPDRAATRLINARLRHSVGRSPRRTGALGDGHAAALLVLGDWEGASLRLHTVTRAWSGLGDGHGHLRERRVDVIAQGRGGAGRPRVARLWLPDRDGGVAELTDHQPAGQRDARVTEQPSGTGGAVTSVA